MDQMPCSHAIAVFLKANIDPYGYCSIYFQKDSMVAAYKETVYPLGNKETWEIPESVSCLRVNPPEGRIRAGRPKKKRYKAFWEKEKCTVKLIKCSRCDQVGHNRRTCRNPKKKK